MSDFEASLTPGTLDPCYPASADDLCKECVDAILAVISIPNFTCFVAQAGTPSAGQQSCIWFDTTHGVLKQYTGGAWTVIPLDRQYLSFFINYYAEDTGGANAAVIAFPDRTLSAYAKGLLFWVKMVANNTGATTLKVDALAAVAVKKYTANGMSDLIQGDLKANGIYGFVHDGTQFVCVNPTPAQIQRQVFDDAVTLDTRIKTSPNPSLACEFNHGFTRGGSAVAPDVSEWVLVCQNADAGFSAGDEVDLDSFWVEEGAANDVELAFSQYRNTTIVGACPTWFDAGVSISFIVNSADGTEQVITTNKWKLRNRCFLF